MKLPIEAVLPDLTAQLASASCVVLQAPPGAGKSTVVPLALLGCDWLGGRRIIMLEPRRLAARAVAARMAQTLGEAVGRTVGHRMRMDTRVSRETRIEVVTEGVLTRMLQQDAALEGVGLVIFDEFHERSLQADLGLALTLDAQANLAPELKLLVMSATLDAQAIAARLGEAPVVCSAGRTFAVETRYAAAGAPLLPGPMPGGESVEALTTRIVRRALTEEPGDVLVFLPGAREIRRVQSQLQGGPLPAGTRVLPLYGELRPEEQDAALMPAAAGARKVVLATNIAETSLTIEGIRIVVDSGLERRAVFDPVTGMGRLETARISRASADQRQGRAGRLEAGVCYRAWSEGAQRSLAPFSSPEILQTDLSGLALELAAWGVIDATTLVWLDPPPAATLASARDLLRRLDALDGNGRVTAGGREMARLPVHPRLAHMLLAGRRLGCIQLAAQLAALLSERDLLRAAGGAMDADVRSRLSLLQGEGEPAGIDRSALQRARRTAKELQRQAAAAGAGTPDAGTGTGQAGLEGVLLAFAYPDRIARKRAGGDNRFVLANGRGAQFAQPQSLSQREFIVAIDADDRDRDARITLAAPLARADLEEYFSSHLSVTDEVHWDDRERAVVARRVTRLFELEIEERPLREVPVEAASEAMLEGIGRLGLTALPWDPDSRELQARMEFVRANAPGTITVHWPAVDDPSLSANLRDWLLPWLGEVTRAQHLARLSMTQILQGLLSREQQRYLEELAPTHFTAPTGSRIRIDYRDELAPVIAVRLQEVFGVLTSPRLAGGRVPVTFKLLSPAQRPVQITRDLATFWQGSYADVRKDMRGRYPRHYWPEDPAIAEPTRRARPSGGNKPRT